MPLANFSEHACVLNSGPEAWVFEEHASRMARALGLEVRAEPARFNYVLGWSTDTPLPGGSFIPEAALRCTADKRLQAEAFNTHVVPTPETIVLGTTEALQRFLDARRDASWVLKYPTGSGAMGHRVLSDAGEIPHLWEPPFQLQRFVEMSEPEVYRIYIVGEEAAGWNARRYPEGVPASPFVAHARGARYVDLGAPPSEVVAIGQRAMHSVGLEGRFGAVDLILDAERWLVLEVNTDGPYQYVDRDFDSATLDTQIAACFSAWASEAG